MNLKFKSSCKYSVLIRQKRERGLSIFFSATVSFFSFFALTQEASLRFASEKLVKYDDENRLAAEARSDEIEPDRAMVTRRICCKFQVGWSKISVRWVF